MDIHTHHIALQRGGGKTTALVDIAVEAVKNGKEVAYCSMGPSSRTNYIHGTMANTDDDVMRCIKRYDNMIHFIARKLDYTLLDDAEIIWKQHGMSQDLCNIIASTLAEKNGHLWLIYSKYNDNFIRPDNSKDLPIFSGMDVVQMENWIMENKLWPRVQLKDSSNFIML